MKLTHNWLGGTTMKFDSFVCKSGDDFIKITIRILIEVRGVWGSCGRDSDKLPASCSSKISVPN